MVSTTDLYNVGLLETMCFLGLDEANYWYIKDNYLYHHNRMSNTIHRKLLDQKMNPYLYSSRQWKPI